MLKKWVKQVYDTDNRDEILKERTKKRSSPEYSYHPTSIPDWSTVFRTGDVTILAIKQKRATFVARLAP
jgi:hypothetical protein